MTAADRRPVLVDKDLADLLETLTPFRTEARAGMNNVRYEDGLFAGYQEPRKLFAAQEGANALETGLLVDAWYDKFIYDYTKGLIDYVVYSYDTIIAWHTKKYQQGRISNGINPARWVEIPAQWTVTDTVITATTAKHQWRISIALKQKGLL